MVKRWHRAPTSASLRASAILLAAVLSACGGGGRGTDSTSASSRASQKMDVGPITDDLLEGGHRAEPAMWPTYGGDWAQTRYSPLTDIRLDNVTRLRPAWIAQTGIVGSFENTPAVAGREMYVTTPSEQGKQRVMRLDSTTGAEVWKVEIAAARPDEDAATEDLHLPNRFGPNRGVAIYRNRVYTGTLNGTLLALDRETGARVFEVKTLSPRLTGAPTVARGRVIQGLSWIDRGAVQAFDANDGRLLWTWYAIPSPEDGGWWGDWVEMLPGRPEIGLGRNIAEEKKNQARLRDTWKTGGASAPMTPTFDPASGLIFTSTGGPDPTAFPPPSEPHPGDMRWTNSVCAIRLEDGRTAWCYQFLPHDVWGASGPTPPILFQMSHQGRTIDVVGKFTGMGNLIVLDRKTGALIMMSDNYLPLKETTGGPSGVNLIKGGMAGTLWSPGAYSAETGLLYSVNQRVPGYFQPREQARGRDQFGNIAAVNPSTGKVIWQQRTERPMLGGILATAGGLVFAGRTTGTFDAYHAGTGEHVWSFRMGAGCNAAPMTYRVGGRQYVAIACGGHGGLDPQGGDALAAFALPD